MVLAAGTFVANDTCMKVVVAHLPPMQALFLRGLIASLWCLPLMLALGYRIELRQFANRWLVLRGLGEALGLAFYIQALARMPIADIIAILQISPLLVVIGVALIWREPVGPLRLALIGIGIGGALLVAQPGAATASPYALLGLAASIGTAARDIFSRRVPASIPAFVVTYGLTVIVTLACGVLSVPFETWAMPTAGDVLMMVVSGVLLFGAHYLVYLAYRLAPAKVLAPFYYTFTLWAVAAGFLVFGDLPNRLAVAGMAAILATGLGVVLLDGRRWRAVFTTTR